MTDQHYHDTDSAETGHCTGCGRTDLGSRFCIVSPDDGDVFGPYDRREIRAAMLDDLCDPDIATPTEATEYRAMTIDSLIDEYQDTTGAEIRVMSEPTDEWRQEVATDG